jgi:hypothetical protein
MKKQRNPKASKTQLALELGECSCRVNQATVPLAKASVQNADVTPNNIICIKSDLKRSDQNERGLHYANIMALTKHLDVVVRKPTRIA